MNDLYFQQKCPYCFSAFQVFSAIIFFIFRVCNFWHVHNLPLKPFCNISKWYFYFFLWINPKCSCFLSFSPTIKVLKWFRTEQPVTRNTGVGKLFNDSANLYHTQSFCADPLQFDMICTVETVEALSHHFFLTNT